MPFRTFATLALFEEGFYHGMVARSKQIAKSFCASAIAEKIFTDGRLSTKKERKRPKSESNDIEVDMVSASIKMSSPYINEYFSHQPKSQN